MDAGIPYTGLTSAIFTRDSVEISCPDSTAGLYVKTRSGQIVKVYIFLLIVLLKGLIVFMCSKYYKPKNQKRG